MVMCGGAWQWCCGGVGGVCSNRDVHVVKWWCVVRGGRGVLKWWCVVVVVHGVW